MEYTKEQLIEICEKAIVSEKKWKDRDSAKSQKGVGQAWALLRAGCEFKIVFNDGNIKTDENTIWIQFFVRDFAWFEFSESIDEKGNDSLDHQFYLPTLKRLEEVKDEDWY